MKHIGCPIYLYILVVQYIVVELKCLTKKLKPMMRRTGAVPVVVDHQTRTST
jgi:hypothetical protein